MDLDSILRTLENTFVDQAQGVMSFEGADGKVLRFELDVADRFGRAVIQRGDDLLIVGQSAATAIVGGTVESGSGNLQATWDAWKQRPPISVGTVATGLQLLQTSSSAVNGLARSLANSGGSLAVGGLVVLCWHSARYDALSLPGIELTDVEGRVCFRDVTLSATEIGLALCLEVSCARAQVALQATDSLDLRQCVLRLNATARLDLITLEPTATIEHALFRCRDGIAVIDGIGVKRFAGVIEAEQLHFEKSHFTDGALRLTVGPAAPLARIPIQLPPTFGTGDVKFGGVRDASFRSLDAELRLLDSGRQVGRIDFRGGSVRADLVEFKAPGDAQVAPKPGLPFQAEVKAITRRLFPDGAADNKLAFCLNGGGSLETPLRLPIAGFTLEIKAIDRIGCNAWSVGEHDSRIGLVVEKASGQLIGDQLPDGALAIIDATVRLFWDEYGPCVDLPRVARRQITAQFELLLAGFPKRLVNEPFRTGEVPISPSAILRYVGDRIDSNVLQFVLDLIARGYALAGVIDVDVYLVFHGSFTVDFDPGQSTDNRLVFHAKLIVKMDVILRIYAQVGICPICIRKKIKEIQKTVNLLDVDLDLVIEWEFDAAMNAIRIRNVEVSSPDKTDLVALLGALVAEIYLKKAAVGKSVKLPPGFHVRGVRVSFADQGDDTIRIGLGVEADSMDWG